MNVWVLPDLNEELSAGLTLEGPTAGEKAFESRLEEGCYYLLFDSRSHRGANHDVRRWISHILAPANLIYHAEEQYQTWWFPAYGLLPRWHHAQPVRSEKPAGLETITLSYYRDHIEHRFLARIMSTLLAAEGVTLAIQEVDYDEWHRGDVISDIWLNSANFTLPLDFSLFLTCTKCP